MLSTFIDEHFLPCGHDDDEDDDDDDGDDDDSDTGYVDGYDPTTAGEFDPTDYDGFGGIGSVAPSTPPSRRRRSQSARTAPSQTTPSKRRRASSLPR